MNQTATDRLNTGFFGHPTGLQTLFFTEMWERMSYYGMRGLLILFMTATAVTGGYGVDEKTAAAIYGIYASSVYLMGLPGGWIADRLIGGQKAIWYGGLIIMSGHIVLAFPSNDSFFIGLILVVLGTGLLKPNISALVGQLYPQDDARRDSGYAIYYMGINVGSVIGYTVCGYLSQAKGWHWGFGAAAVGMAFGLIQFRMTTANLQNKGEAPIAPVSENNRSKSWLVIIIFLLLLALVTALTMSGTLVINPLMLAKAMAVFVISIFLLYFAAIFFLGKLDALEKKGMMALFLVCVASASFFAGFEQAGSSLNLFGQNFTDRLIGNFEVPTTWLQNANPAFIVILTPFFAALWIYLGKQVWNPSSVIKCAIGLAIMGSGFIVMFFAAQIAASGLKAPMYLLVATYFLHTVGELCLSPVALSAVSKLSPQRFAGQMMGVFVLTYSIGNIVAGLLAGNFDSENVAQMPGQYLSIAQFSIAAGIIILVFGFLTRRWEFEVEHSEDKSKPDEDQTTQPMNV